MTEQEWQDCTDPYKMLVFLRGKVSRRKLRLFACACCRRVWHVLTDPRTRRAVEVAEKHADGLVSDAERWDAHEAACEAARTSPGPAAVYAATYCGTNVFDEEAFTAANNSSTFAAQSISSTWDAAPVPAEREAQSRLLRDIVRNPFRPASLDPAWLSWAGGIVPELARPIYDHRAFDRLPALADALEAAGCTDEDMLEHLRGPGPHTRGCWALDHILGLEGAMTEEEWLHSYDPVRMLDYLQVNGIISDRKQRLFDCACVRRIWHLLTDERGRRAVEVAERYADDLADLDELREAQAVALAAADAQATLFPPGSPNSYTVLKAAAGTAWEYRSGADPLLDATAAIAWEDLTGNDASQRRQGKARMAEERKVQAAYLRDIIGNPIRPVAVDPRWLTDAVVDLAESLYRERAFDRLPALADTLDKAGCSEAQLLAHCWLPGPHVRGCWAVSLVLGKA